MELISREAAIAAMKKATKEVGFNPFKVLNELPEVEAVTFEELNAAIKDARDFCDTKPCGPKCDYYNDGACAFSDLEEYADAKELILAYRCRKEMGLC